MAATHEERQGHTSGPWAVETPSKGSLEWEVVKLDGPDEPWRIALCYDGADGASSEANARLIAASPLMFEYVARRASEGDAEARKIVETINAAR